MSVDFNARTQTPPRRRRAVRSRSVAARNRREVGRLRRRAKFGETDARGRGSQSLQADYDAKRSRRRRSRQVERFASRPDRLREDAPRANARSDVGRSVRHRGRDDADRSRLRRRRRRKPHFETPARRRLRRRTGAARDYLHRRNRQNRQNEPKRLDHPRRFRRRRSTSALENARRNGRKRSAARRAQAPGTAVHSGRHVEHSLHLRRFLRRLGADRREPPREAFDRFFDRRRLATRRNVGRANECNAGRPLLVRADSGTRRALAGRRVARTADRRRALPSLARAEKLAC